MTGISNRSTLLRIIGIALLAFSLVACGSAVRPTETPVGPTPSPPTATAFATPTPQTLEGLSHEELVELLLIEADAIAEEADRFRGENRALDVVNHYVPVYLASACVENREPSIADFKLYTNNAVGNRRLVEREARQVIRVIIPAANSWRDQRLAPDTQQCLRPYLFPDSVSDAKPAIDIYLAFSLPPLEPLDRGVVEAQIGDRAGGWFETDRQEPYISWLCGGDC